MHTRTDWQELIAEVPRDPFIPDTIWVDVDTGRPQSGFVALSKQDDPQRWRELVGANEAVITQVDEGLTAVGDTGWSPSSSCSKPSTVADMLDVLDVHPGHSVLEIGTGTGWNAALLCQRVGERGRVVSIEVDPLIAQAARTALTRAGCSPLVITGDGADDYPDGATYDRVLATAAVREIVPRAWLEQTRPGGLIVTPWGTDYCNGVMLTLHVAADGTVTGRFGGDLAFMRLRSQRRHFYEPDDAEIAHAEVTTTEVHGWDFFRMISSNQAAFADVASAVLRGRISTILARQLAGKTLAITFVTVGELTKWTLVRHWGPQRRLACRPSCPDSSCFPTAKPWPACGESFRPTPSSRVDHGQQTTRGSRHAVWSASCRWQR